ncbi:GNAT family N-acetyltransferase [Vibrio kyushuensis]|uniref:GNAT family N-acetyltransferase n=1 Tax=Vibrio kyushuensis TaxID=2910249 RepID=UPI003D0BC35A
MPVVCETERLVIRRFNLNDAEFILQLLNEESFIRYIADKNVKTIDDAIKYLKSGPMACYQIHGFGLSLVQLKETGAPIGMCGLLKRDELELPDLGYAFLSDFCGKGYANEAADSILKTEMNDHSLVQVLAVTLPDNVKSNKLLKNIGFTFNGTMDLYNTLNNVYEFSVTS